MNSQAFLGILARHALTAAATMLAARGYIAESEVEGVASAVLFLGALGWSAWRKHKDAKLPPNPAP